MRRSVACNLVLAMVLLGGVTSRSELRPLRSFESSGPASVPGPAEVIYSNFGPDMAFDSSQNHRWTINGYLGPNIGQQAISQQFTPSGDYTFHNAQVAVILDKGPNRLHVFLQADSHGLPGAVIEEIPIGGFGYTSAIVTAQSALSPTLYKDTPYWLTLVAVDNDVIAGWNWNSVGDASSTTFASTQGGSAAGPWSVGRLETRSVFQINGTPPTPGPQPTSTPPTPGPQSTIYLPLIKGPPYYQIAFISQRDGNPEIYVMNVDGSNRTYLHGGGDPDWSPDGSRITFVDRGNIYTMRADGSDVVALTKQGPNNKGSPDWSPGGQWIAFVWGESLYYYGYDVCVKKASGIGSTLCPGRALSDGDEYNLAWSPDGRWLAFSTSYPFYESSIYIVHPEGTNLTRLTAGGGALAWSPDGRRIAFEQSGDIYVINVDGSNRTNLTTNPADDTNPVWSPDGRRIAFVSNRDGNKEIYVMSADGSSPIRLTTDPADDTNPVWSPTNN